MKKVLKRGGALFCACLLLAFLCFPCIPTYAAMNVRGRNALPDAVEYPMRRAVREGSEALDEVLPKPEHGTVNDITQGASDGMLDGTKESSSASETASESITGQENASGKSMTAVAVTIAVLAAVAIIILILIAIPKKRGRHDGTNNHRNH